VEAVNRWYALALAILLGVPVLLVWVSESAPWRGWIKETVLILGILVAGVAGALCVATGGGMWA
jgi:hypothetical protein